METLIDLIEQLKHDMHEFGNTYIDDDNLPMLQALANMEAKAFYTIEIATSLKRYMSNCEGLIKRMGWQ